MIETDFTPHGVCARNIHIVLSDDGQTVESVECRAGLYALAGMACEGLTFSGFEACDLELAERMKLKGYRVRMTPEGQRVTTVRRSDLLPYALDAWGIEPLAR